VQVAGRIIKEASTAAAGRVKPNVTCRAPPGPAKSQAVCGGWLDLDDLHEVDPGKGIRWI